MFIRGHPPVTNLYETFVFVAWAAAILGLVLEALQKKGVGFIIASICGFFMLHIAGRYAADGDTMGMLSAVLNNTFWLSSHIVTIALGYAGIVAAGIAGHVYCIQEMVQVRDPEKRSSTARTVYGILAFGLTFTVIGTILGGLWADQSWGRFWGWDPKENGALLIILWCSILFHARADGMIRARGFAMGSIVGIIFVMFAWLGVNMLGVGLHSYGFTSRGARILFGVIGFEVLFLVFVGIYRGIYRGRTTK
jgi:ABC-type transport system involved in cytochrome c biogenesis permease subunit